VHGAGFHVAAGGALLGLVLFVIAERRGPRRFTPTLAGGMM
jgi:hypothetical protein